ncbi:MAG: radical SAM protein [Hyphomonadaceae bacterium]|nr:radical SAM protein [Hyphomonadaceae bacterium]
MTAKGETRARVRLERLSTLWFNTGTLCNITCAGCYIESSPTNDALVYLAPQDMAPFLAEVAPGVEIGFTGGEPFLNPHIIALMEMALVRGHRALVLTNAMAPMMRPRVQAGLLALRATYGDAMTLRVSLDSPDAALHDVERGAGSFAATVRGLDWLAEHGFKAAIAGRLWGRTEDGLRAAYARLAADRGWSINADDPSSLVLFPEMDAHADVPEITTACWGILHKSPGDVMCASSRMIVKRRGEAAPRVVACTLLPYDPRFDLGPTLADAAREVALNHPHCAKFCVLGGGKCAA